MHRWPKISVIIPVYNVEAYIGRCARNLFGQTLDAIELIFVDDGSTDGSLAIISNILDEYPHRKPQTTILRHECNLGVAAARTTGMKVMTGEYMAHCDPDDIPDADMYRQMYEEAKAWDADIVSCTYLEEPGDGQPHGPVFSGDTFDVLRPGNFSYGLWNKIIRTSIIKDHEIYPYAGIDYNEDLNVMVRALCHSRRIRGLDTALYLHTARRDGSICSGDYRRLLLEQSVPCMRLLDEYLDTLGRESADARYTSRLTAPIKFWMKNALFNAADIELWCSLWPECRRTIPKLRGLNIKERTLMFLLARSPKTLRRILKHQGKENFQAQ